MSKCEHGKQTRYCKVCGGSAYCEHDKIKSQCKQCGGSAICEHKKLKTQCRDCGGSAFCKHDLRKSKCEECGGSDICEHKRQKSHCKECGGSTFCQHKKRKSRCKECGGADICEHGKRKSGCKDCGGADICEHKIFKKYCKECDGSAYCEHTKIKTQCRACGGSAYCEHDKLKPQCKKCGGSRLCKTSFCETGGHKKYNGYCLPCCVQICPEIEVSRNYKTKEKDVVDRIKHYFPNFTWVADKRVQDGCSLRRPDLLLDMGSHIIIVEVDENQHSDYDCSCEHKRLMQISQDLGHRPIVFIRFNPDAYTNQEGVLVKSCWKLNQLGVMTIGKTKEKEWEERIENLKTQIQYWIDNPTEKTVEIIQLFY